MKLKLVFAVLALLFAVFALPVQAEGTATAALPAIHVGDTWAYAHTNNPSNTTTFTVVGVHPDGGFTVKFNDSLQGERTREYDPGWNELLSPCCGSSSPQKRDIFHFPLQAGQLPYSGTTFSLPRPRKPGVTLTETAMVKSVTAEKVPVKAGTFEALKIAVETQYKLTTGYANRLDEVFWYVPSIGRWVKYTMFDWGRPRDPDEMELTEFKRGE